MYVCMYVMMMMTDELIFPRFFADECDKVGQRVAAAVFEAATATFTATAAWLGRDTTKRRWLSQIARSCVLSDFCDKISTPRDFISTQHSLSTFKSRLKTHMFYAAFC